MKQSIVISAVNIIEGGPLSVLQDCLKSIEHLTIEYDVKVLVHKKELVPHVSKAINIIEIPKAKKNWGLRLYYEYIYFKKLSKNWDVKLWISLHDMTPNVVAEKRVVYCHNPSPFYKVKKKDFTFDKKFALFTLFYKKLYSINIKKNTNVIVQQCWIKDEFIKMFKLEANKIIVAKPTMSVEQLAIPTGEIQKGSYIYPAFPRVFKNIECIGEALKILNTDNIQVHITLNGKENAYANYIYETYKNVKGMNFIGLQSREEIFKLYSSTEGLIFPSKLETWGLPLSEFSLTGKKIIAADLPYVKETINGYDNVAFFDPTDPNKLAEILRNDFQKSENSFDLNKFPDTESWADLFDRLLK